MFRAVRGLMTLAFLGISAGIGNAQETRYCPSRDSHRARVGAQAALVGQLAAAHRRSHEVRAAREPGFLNTLHEVEKAAAPFPDDPPIRYPRPEKWRPLSARRREADRPHGLRAREAAERRIEEALRSPTELDFVAVGLSEAIEYLKDLHGIEIQLDCSALAEEGLRTDVPLTRRLQGISLRSALRLILRDFDLTHVVQEDVLLITTQERARNMRKVEVYPVGDLMRPRLRALPVPAPRPYVPVPFPGYPFPGYAHPGYGHVSTTTILAP